MFQSASTKKIIFSVIGIFTLFVLFHYSSGYWGTGFDYRRVKFIGHVKNVIMNPTPTYDRFGDRFSTVTLDGRILEGKPFKEEHLQMAKDIITLPEDGRGFAVRSN